MKIQLISLFCIVMSPYVASEVCNGFETCPPNVTYVNEGDKVTLQCSLRKPITNKYCSWLSPDNIPFKREEDPKNENNCNLNLNNVAPHEGGTWTCVEGVKKGVKGVVQKDPKDNQHSVSGTLVVKGQCYTGNGTLYAGLQSRTVSGKKCESWTVANLKKSNPAAMNALNFPEGNITEASNYCRNPDNDVMPWCYTTDPKTRWEFCNISKCDDQCHGNRNSTLTTLIKGCGNYHLQCSGVIINSDIQDVKSKEGPSQKTYPNNQACTYNMTSPIGTIIKLSSVEFQLEQKYDTLTVYDGDKQGAKLGEYTGSSNFDVISSSNQITMVFSTDATITDDGFRIHFQVLGGCNPLDINKCGTYNVNCGGNIYSQNYPSDYNSHADCNYNLIAPPNSQIQFSSVSFNSEAGYDNLTIYDGSSQYGQVLGSYSGLNKNFSVNTSQSSALLRFMTDQAKVHEGFHIRYIVMPQGGFNGWSTFGTTTSSNCEETKSAVCGTYGGCRGVIRNQNYPLNYPNGANCRYIIKGKTADSIIKLTSNYFNTEECCDTLTVYNQLIGTKHAQPVGVYKGNMTMNLQLKGVVTLLFQTDFAKTDRGFDINYTISPPN